MVVFASISPVKSLPPCINTDTFQKLKGEQICCFVYLIDFFHILLEI